MKATWTSRRIYLNKKAKTESVVNVLSKRQSLARRRNVDKQSNKLRYIISSNSELTDINSDNIISIIVTSTITTYNNDQ
jgi:hypothetical protein